MFWGQIYMSMKYSLSSKTSFATAAIPLSSLIQVGDTPIAKDKFHCEKNIKMTVASVLGSILTTSMTDKETRTDYTCESDRTTDGQTCRITQRGGMLQPSEYGRRTLEFKADKNLLIRRDSFECYIF